MVQQNLSTYCAGALRPPFPTPQTTTLADENTDSNIDIIPMAFMFQMTTGIGGEPVIDFSTQSRDCQPFNGTGLLECPQIADDIATCQQKHNKTILLSIGGATYTEGGFLTAEAAEKGAKKIWETFGPRQSNSSALRPFGDVSVDGFDFDFESVNTNMVPFGQTLRSLMDDRTSRTGDKYYLTAAPQCPFPDAADKEMLDGKVAFDVVFVQFYNNYCGVQSYQPNATEQNNFNFNTWDNWAKNTSLNKGVKVFLGVPAGPTAAGSGYVPVDTLAAIVEYCKTFDSFGGVMMWDASQAYANQGFLPGVKKALGAMKRRMVRSVRWRRRDGVRV
jgi:chitinase